MGRACHSCGGRRNTEPAEESDVAGAAQRASGGQNGRMGAAGLRVWQAQPLITHHALHSTHHTPSLTTQVVCDELCEMSGER